MRRGRPRHDDILTPREWEVMPLLREGQTNEHIAARLGISLSTAKYHVSSILAKLDAETREQAIANLDRRAPRHVPVLSPGLMLSLRRALPWAAALVVGGVVSVAVVLRLGDSGVPNQVAPGDNAGVGLDVGADANPTETPEVTPSPPDFANTVLLTKLEPANVGDAAEALSGITRVSTARELQAALQPDTNLIIVDSSALEEVRGSDILVRELGAGRWIMGLNVTNTELREVTDLTRSAQATRPR